MNMLHCNDCGITWQIDEHSPTEEVEQFIYDSAQGLIVVHTIICPPCECGLNLELAPQG